MSQSSTGTRKVKIEFAPGKRNPIEVDLGSPLMKALLAHQIPVASSCNGDGVCSKCHLQIIRGRENLAPAYPQSIGTDQFLNEKNKIGASSVISCQWLVMGDIQVDAKYW